MSVTSGLTWVFTVILETEVSLLKGTDPGQAGCHRLGLFMKNDQLNFPRLLSLLTTMWVNVDFFKFCEFVRIRRISRNSLANFFKRNSQKFVKIRMTAMIIIKYEYELRE